MSKRIHKQKENPTPEKSIRNNEKEEEGMRIDAPKRNYGSQKLADSTTNKCTLISL